ncbi:MAG TPA: hypothetical protein V6D50_22570 [Chroococcales cyanobacterium]|jgi:hypothetical protein
MVATLVDTNAMLHELAPPVAGNYRHCVHEICKTDNTDRLKEMTLTIDDMSCLNEAVVSIEVQAEWEVLSRSHIPLLQRAFIDP